jgi:Skp family chaperone for outer membrane proteins
MTTHPATPPNGHVRNSRLWPSPQFSDYFSDSENAGQHGVSNPIQSRILGRLDAIRKKISAQGHDGSKTPHLLDFENELSALESRLNAPESQTREIAEETHSGLFADDEEETAAVLQEENEGLRRQVREGQDIIERLTRVRKSLQHHYDEVKVISPFSF